MSAGNRHTAAGTTDRLLFPGLPGMFTPPTRKNRGVTEVVPPKKRMESRFAINRPTGEWSAFVADGQAFSRQTCDRYWSQAPSVGGICAFARFPPKAPCVKGNRRFSGNLNQCVSRLPPIVISSGTCVPPLLPTENSACGCIRIALFLFRCARVAEYDARFGHDAGTFFEFAIRFRLIGTLLHKKILRY